MKKISTALIKNGSCIRIIIIGKMKKMRKIAIIPARYESSRFPGKPLALICDKPMIQWVYEAVSDSHLIDDVYVATDDKRILYRVSEFGGKALMTSDSHKCGTDRLAEAANILKLEREDIVLNIQGDEPMVTTQMVETLARTLDSDADMGTLKQRISSKEELENPNVVKVITDLDDRAIYFSRYCLPYNRNGNDECNFYKHIGAYAYKKDFLDRYSKMEQTPLEKAESLEQLRVIENGYTIKVLETDVITIGVDTPEQLLQAEAVIRAQGELL